MRQLSIIKPDGITVLSEALSQFHSLEKISFAGVDFLLVSNLPILSIDSKWINLLVKIGKITIYSQLD